MSLEIRNLTFSYRNLPLCQKDVGEENRVLNNFSAEFQAGKITALTGDNGSGKTTLARLIMGIQKPDVGGGSATSGVAVDTTKDIATGATKDLATGTFFVDGQCIDNWSLAERGSAIGYVMQNPAKQIFNDTVLDEVMYGLLNQGMDCEEAKAVAIDYIDRFGLTHHINDFPFNLSHGEKQRLVLAAVLAMKPKYLILDEPTASLDTRHKEILGALLRQIVLPHATNFRDDSREAFTDVHLENNVAQGCGVIVITHDQKFMESYCDEVIKLKNGEETENG